MNTIKIKIIGIDGNSRSSIAKLIILSLSDKLIPIRSFADVTDIDSAKTLGISYEELDENIYKLISNGLEVKIEVEEEKKEKPKPYGGKF